MKEVVRRWHRRVAALVGWLALAGCTPSAVRLPAEFEPTQTVLLAWRDYPEELSFVASAAAQAGANVWVFDGPERLGPVPPGQYRALPLEVVSPWVRDYAPLVIERDGRAVVLAPRRAPGGGRGPPEDTVPCRVAEAMGLPCEPLDLLLEGGNLSSDGQGTLFTSVRTYEQNAPLSPAEVDRRLRERLGASRVIAFQPARTADGRPADGTGHLDMFFQLVAPCRALVAESTDEPFAAALEAVVAQLGRVPCAGGGTYRVDRVPGRFLDGVWSSFTNALLVNGTVVLPGFRGGDTMAAKRTFEQALPGATVVPVFVEGPLRAGGAVHCLTANVPRIRRRQSSPGALALLGLVVVGGVGLAVAFALRRRLSSPR